MTGTTEKSAPSRNKKATVAEAFSPPVPDDLRRDAMRHLLDHLESGSSLILRCEDLVASQSGDRTGPINAAARVLLANAKVADALARISQVEQRKRSVVLHLQDDRPTREELIREMEEENAQSGEDVVARLERRLNEILEREQAAKKLMAQPLPARLLPKDQPAPESPDGDAEPIDVDDEADDDS